MQTHRFKFLVNQAFIGLGYTISSFNGCSSQQDLSNLNMTTKNLAIFDFDYTVVSKNTDTEVANLVEKETLMEARKIIDTKGWTAFMAEIFGILHSQNVPKATIHTTIIQIPETEGMCELFKALHDELNYEIIIMSDSNQVFIQDWLDAHNVRKYIKQVFTNPAEYDESGLLCIQPYQIQDECKLCPKNLCKGSIMKKYIEINEKLGIEYNKIIYAGDGSNDFCPMIKLRSQDTAFPRLGYRIMSAIETNRNDADLVIKANVQPWNNACDILKIVREQNIF